MSVNAIHVDHDTTKRLGHWTDATEFAISARYGSAVVDLRSPEITGRDDIVVTVAVDHGTIKLLVPDDAVIDQTGLTWTGRGRVKDMSRPKAAAGRVVRLTGTVISGEIRVHRAGIAVLSALFSREFFEDAKQARKEGRTPSVADPAHTPR